MTGRLLLKGMLAGLLAGILAFGFASFYAEPKVSQAIAFEKGHAGEHAEHHATPEVNNPVADEQEAHSHGEEEVVSRHVQSTIGLFTGLVVYSISMGGIFALVFAYCVGRVGRLQPRALAGVIALIAFAVVVLIPGLKYPANPPAVGDPATIVLRTKSFFLMILVSVTAAVVSLNVARKILRYGGGWRRALLGTGLYLLIMMIAGGYFPSFNEVPASFPSELMWDFRVAFLGIHAVLWATLALVFGSLVTRYRHA